MSGADLNASPSPPVESRADLVEALSQGRKAPAEWRIGTEHEKSRSTSAPTGPVPYEGDNGIPRCSKASPSAPARPHSIDNGNVIGLKGPDGWGISLEPGGQFELSGAPRRHDPRHRRARPPSTSRIANAVAEPLDIGFLGMGVTPIWAARRHPADAEVALRAS